MSADTLERDELLEQVLEDERSSKVQEFREREEILDAAELVAAD